MNEHQLKSLINIITMGAKVLATRTLVYITMLLTFGLFAWAMYDPVMLRVGTAITFAMLVYWPALRLDKESRNEKNETEQT
jgi:hypothetical protein